jgi:hypothetical protein
VSLLVANGFHDAELYPIGILILESDIVDQRIRSLEVTRATFTLGAVSAVHSKQAGSWFRSLIDKFLGRKGP